MSSGGSLEVRKYKDKSNSCGLLGNDSGGLPFDPKATPSCISEKNMATATRSKARLSNGALSPAVFSHSDASLGPCPRKSSKGIPLPRTLPIFQGIKEDQLLDGPRQTKWMQFMERNMLSMRCPFNTAGNLYAASNTSPPKTSPLFR
ncbi:hypothetical protein BSKO_10850 [Bryopsis sp. KO-2023]|nr:hypothetical protein BSKO_10850 [Bryopsis sp. KO-2023]